MSFFTVNGTLTEKRPPLGVVSLLPSCLPEASSTSTVSCSERADVPLTEIGLRHCVSDNGVLTTIGGLTGPVVVAVLVEADCFEDEQPVAPRTSSATKARRATAPSPARSRAAPRGRPGAGRRSPRARRRRAS